MAWVSDYDVDIEEMDIVFTPEEENFLNGEVEIVLNEENTLEDFLLLLKKDLQVNI